MGVQWRLGRSSGMVSGSRRCWQIWGRIDRRRFLSARGHDPLRRGHHMRDSSRLSGAVVAYAAALAMPVAWGGVVDPHLRTDRSVDTRSARTIMRDLVQPGMSEE